MLFNYLLFNFNVITGFSLISYDQIGNVSILHNATSNNTIGYGYSCYTWIPLKGCDPQRVNVFSLARLSDNTKGHSQ